LGIWFVIGGGVALSYLPGVPGAFKMAVEEEGVGRAIKSTLLGLVVWFILFLIAGPIGFIIRLIKTR